MTGGEFDAVGARPSPVCSAATLSPVGEGKGSGGATKDFGRFRGGVVGGGVFVWASGFRTGGPGWGYLT